MKTFKVIWNVIWTLFGLAYLAVIVVILGFPKTYGKFIKKWTDKVEEAMEE